VYVLEADGVPIGWHRVTRRGSRAELEDLWLEPAHIGQGLGRRLFRHAVTVARRLGARSLEWDADPYALGFYTAMGGREIGRSPSSVVPGRTLPRMRLDLPATPAGGVGQSRRSTRPMRPKGGRGSA
jgi:ribosomal protein S18 acetylase RimI-like enzyme